MAFNMAEARVLITTQTSGQQEIAQLQQRIRELQGEVANTSTGMQRLTSTAGAQRAGMQQLGMQLGDVATQYSMGTSAMQIFAQQSGQVVGALQLMSTETSGLLGFLGGPWGMILSAAAVALTPFIGKLFETGDAATTAKQRVYELKDALADIKSKPMEALGNVQSQLLTAEGRLRAAQNMPRYTGGGSDAYKANTFVEKARQKAIDDALYGDGTDQNPGVIALRSQLKIVNQVARDTQTLATSTAASHTTSTTATRTHTAAVREHTSAVKAQVDVYQKLQDRLTAMPLAIQSEKLPDLRADAADALKNMPRNIIDVPDLNPAYNGKMKALEDYGKTAGLTAQNVSKAWTDALNNTEDALVNFATTGKLNFKSLANSIIADIARIAIQQAIMKPLTSWLGGLFGNGAAFSGGNVVASANGNAFSGGNVTAFAGGGVVARPTLFPMAGGKTGLMGEAGAEAIMPLRRLGNGRLGVEAAGGGVQNVVVNVDASGNQQVQGNQDKAAALGNAISAAVRAELIQQKRPGGLLAA